MTIQNLFLILTIYTNRLLYIFSSTISGVRYCRASRLEMISFASPREIPLELASTFPITKETSFVIETRRDREDACYREKVIRKKRCERKDGRSVDENERKWKRRRIKRGGKKKKARDRFWSIFQGEAEASTFRKWERCGGSGEPRYAGRCEREGPRKRGWKEDWATAQEGWKRKREPRSLKVLANERDGGIEAWLWRPVLVEILYNWKASLKWERFSLYALPSYKSESSPPTG